jgi:hypothetical protein
MLRGRIKGDGVGPMDSLTADRRPVTIQPMRHVAALLSAMRQAQAKPNHQIGLLHICLYLYIAMRYSEGVRV